jgi:hypothetical protein
MAIGSFGILLGVSNEAPGAYEVSTIYLLWPTLFILFIGLCHDLAIIERINSTLLLGVTLASGFALIVLISALSGLNNILYPLLTFQGVAFGLYEGYTEFRTFNLATVMFGFPYILALIIIRRNSLQTWHLLGICFLLFIILTVAIGSGRRMLWLMIFITPIIVLFFLQFSVLRMRPNKLTEIVILLFIVLTISVGLAITILGNQPLAIIHSLFSAFSGIEDSSRLRFEQASSLWKSFTNSPLIGNGLGSTADLVRSVEMPWAYELSYLALLMNVGIIGFFVYMLAVGWIIIKGISLAKRDHDFALLFVPLASAMTAFLIMNGTNPYLAKFDYLWVIFLPVALINAYLTQQDQHA